jgi:hypothetical protein
MHPIQKATTCSVYAPPIGCLFFFIWSIINPDSLGGNHDIKFPATIIGGLAHYLLFVIVGFFLALFIGSPIYFLMHYIGFANSFSSSVLGIIFVVTITGIKFSIGVIVMALTGALVGYSYHFFYNRFSNI